MSTVQAIIELALTAGHLLVAVTASHGSNFQVDLCLLKVEFRASFKMMVLFRLLLVVFFFVFS